MFQIYESQDELPFLAGGGEMGQLIRSTDWSKTSLGLPKQWPTALKQTISIMLSNAFPVLICWGKDYMQLYNDAFRSINGTSKHPKALGASAKETYAEIWDIIGPMFEEVMNGEAVTFPDFMVPLERNGYTENCYFDFSYSPIKDENGSVEGILVICIETTAKVKAIEKLNFTQHNISNMIKQAPVGMCIISGDPLMVDEVNDRFLEIIGKRREQFNDTPYWVVNAETAASYAPVTDQVLKNGKTFHVNDHKVSLTRNGFKEVIYVDFVFEPMKEPDGTTSAIMIVAIEVTEKVLARRIMEESAEEFQTLNEELAAANEEYMATNEELAATNNTINKMQEELQLSEKLFKSIVLNIPKSLIIIIDKNHRFITIEGDLMAKMGYNGSDYAGKHPTEVAPPERYEATKHLYERMLAGESFSEERTSVTGDVFMVHFIPLRDDNDDVTSGLIIALDITSIKQGEKKSATLAAIIESSDDAIISKTLESIITSWNDAAQRMFGYTEEEMIGESIYKLIPIDRKDEEPNILSKLKKGERVEHFETKRLTKDGRLIDVSLTISPVKDKNGNIIGLSKIARDITEQKLVEQRKNDFVAMVSHELKTPLTTVSSFIQILLAKAKKGNDDFQVHALTRAEVQAKKMTTMIHDFLSLARLDDGKIQLNKSAFELAPLIKEVIADIQLLSPNHEIVTSDCSGINLLADRDKIGQVLNNLLSNAIKYSPNGGTVTLGCEKLDGKVKIYVRDQGIGISKEDQTRLFQRFFRSNNKKLKMISGFGIGLYLVSEVLRFHESKIELESQEDVGSTFYFTLDTH